MILGIITKTTTTMETKMDLLNQSFSLNQIFQFLKESQIASVGILVACLVAVYYFGGILFRNYLVKWYTKRRKTIPCKIQTYHDDPGGDPFLLKYESVYNITDDDFSICTIARILFPISLIIFLIIRFFALISVRLEKFLNYVCDNNEKAMKRIHEKYKEKL